MREVIRHRTGFTVVREIHPETKEEHDLLRRQYPHLGAFEYVCVAVTQPVQRITPSRHRWPN